MPKSNIAQPVTFANDAGIDSLNISAGANYTFTPATAQSNQPIAATINGSLSYVASNRVVHFRTLSITPAATLDLNNNDLVVDNANFTTIQQLIFQGYRTSNDPTATGIVSSTGQTAQGNPILALFDNSLVGATDFPFGSGQSIPANAIVGKYTFLGDTDMNGQVTPDDYGAVDANLGATNLNPGIAWFMGDTDFNGNITPDDYGAIDANLGQGTPNPLAAQAIPPTPATQSTNLTLDDPAHTIVE